MRLAGFSLSLALVLTLSACGGTSPLSLLKPSVAANVQAGAVNTQSLGPTTVKPMFRPQAERDIVQGDDLVKVKAETVRDINITEMNWWLVLLLLVGWVLPTPASMGQNILNLFRRFVLKKPGVL